MNLPSRLTSLVRRFRRARAFSLPETTMAVAIAALGIVSVMGLMPQGLETARKTGNIAAQSRIMQEIIGDLQATDWASLDSYVQANPTRSYDDQGIRLTGGGADAQLTSYVAHLDLTADSVMPQTGAGVADPYMRRLVVKVANTSKVNFDFSSTNASRYKVISFLVPKIQ